MIETIRAGKRILTSKTMVRQGLARPAVAGFLTLFVAHGIGRFAFPALIPLLVEQGWIGASQVGYVGTANLAGYLLGALFGVGGKPTNRHIAPFMAAVAISYFACAVPHGFAWLLFWRFVAGVAGGVVMTTGIPIIQAQTEPRRRARVLATTFAGVGAGVVFSGAAAPHLLSHGLGFASAAFGALCVACTAVSWRTWSRSNPRIVESASRPKGEEESSDRRQTLILGFAYATSAVAFVPFVVFWVDYVARGLGRGVHPAALCWMLFGLATMLGPIIAAQFASRVGTARALRWTFIANALAVLLPLASSRLGVLAAASLLGGAAAMGISALTATKVREIAPPPAQQQLWAAMTIVFAIAFAASGWAFSWVFAATHSYRAIFVSSGMALAAGIGVQSLAPQRVRPTAQRKVVSEEEAA